MSEMISPLLFPVYLKFDVIYVLDETELPFMEEYIEVKTLEQALRVLKGMKTRALGQVLLCFYSCILFKDNYAIDEICQKFKEARPTFDFLMIGQIVRELMHRGATLEGAVESFIHAFDAHRRKRAAELAAVLPDQADILTICNVNGELAYLAEELNKLNKINTFYVCETRPFLQGTRLTFWELHKAGVNCKLICDNQAARLMQQGMVNCIVTGADRATVKGDIINKIGTYALARLGRLFGIPLYALTQYPRDIDIDTVKIEERPLQEVFMFLEEDYAGVEALYPAFDVTHREFVTQCMELTAT